MNNDIKNKIAETVKDLLSRIGFEGEVKLTEGASKAEPNGLIGEEEGVAFLVASIESDNDLSMLIGKNGQNLSAFDHVARLVVGRKLGGVWDKSANFIVDVNDYRKSRTNYLVDIARNVAKRVIQTQRAEALLPMNAYERRLVHTELALFKEVQTESIGQEPRRRIVVKPQVESL